MRLYRSSCGSASVGISTQGRNMARSYISRLAWKRRAFSRHSLPSSAYRIDAREDLF